MNFDDRMLMRRVPLFAMGVLALGLAACNPKPSAEQASRDSGRIVDQASGPAAGKEIDPMKSPGKDDVAKSAQSADDNAMLTDKVQAALSANPTLKSLPIKAQAADGVVTLMGTADTPANRNQAEQVVMKVSGVKSVENKLAVGGA